MSSYGAVCNTDNPIQELPSLLLVSPVKVPVRCALELGAPGLMLELHLDAGLEARDCVCSCAFIMRCMNRIMNKVPRRSCCLSISASPRRITDHTL